MKVEHKTIKLKVTYPVSIQRVFKAFASTDEKEKWSAPKGDEIRFLRSNFRIGGVEKFKCGPAGSLDFSGTIHYEDIQKNQRIVYSETVSHKKNLLASALITIEFYSRGSSTELLFTIQVASYCGEQMLKGYKTGYQTSLRNLKEHLTEKTR